MILVFLLLRISASLAGGEIPIAPASSPILYDPGGDRIYVANADSSTLTILDGSGLTVVAEVPVGRDPRSLALGPGGREVFVPGRRDGTVTAVSPSGPHRRRTGRIGVEPRCVLWSPEAASLIVSDRSGGEILWVSPDSLAVTRRLLLERQPLALARIGGRILVGHLNGSLPGSAVSEIDAASGAVLRRIPLRPDAGPARGLALDPAAGRLYVPHTRFAAEPEGLLFDTMIFPALAEIDLESGRLSRTIYLDAVDRPENDPLAAALAPDGRLLVVYGGSETLSAIDLTSRRGAAAGRVRVGRNPRGVAVDRRRRLAYVLNLLSDDVSVVDLATMKELKRIGVTRSPLSRRFFNGKRIFHDGRSARATLDRWMSCASCHPDGESCGRTWRYPQGKRNVQALFGAGRTRPLFWSATRDEIQDFEWAFRKFQGGRGFFREMPFPDLGPPNIGRSDDLDDLALYIGSLEPAPGRYRNRDGTYSRAALRGRGIFFSPETGCAGCHPPPFYTDSGPRAGGPRLHDVGTGVSGGEAPDGDSPERESAFDAPSLVDLEHSAPYLHDGRAETLMDVFTRWNPEDRHGRTGRLAAAELSDLVAFIVSIPLVRVGELLPGDCDLNGRVEAADLERARVFLNGEISPGEAALQNGDLDGNGILDGSDLERIAGLLKEREANR